MGKVIKRCNNCGGQCYYDEQEYTFLHVTNKDYWCDKTHNLGADVTDRIRFQIKKAGFTVITEDEDGKLVLRNPTTKDNLHIDEKSTILATPANKEMFKRYGIA